MVRILRLAREVRVLPPPCHDFRGAECVREFDRDVVISVADRRAFVVLPAGATTITDGPVVDHRISVELDSSPVITVERKAVRPGAQVNGCAKARAPVVSWAPVC